MHRRVSSLERRRAHARDAQRIDTRRVRKERGGGPIEAVPFSPAIEVERPVPHVREIDRAAAGERRILRHADGPARHAPSRKRRIARFRDELRSLAQLASADSASTALGHSRSPTRWTPLSPHFGVSSGVRDVFGQAERAGVRRLEQRTRQIGVPLGNEDLDGTESIDRQAVRVSQRLPSLDA